MGRHVVHTIQTDFGQYPVPKSVAIVMDAAKRRVDGSMDERTAAFRFLSRYQQLAEAIAKAAYVCGSEPVFPEANSVQ